MTNETSKPSNAVTDLIETARTATDPDSAMKYSQAACNAANALDRVREAERKSEPAT